MDFWVSLHVKKASWSLKIKLLIMKTLIQQKYGNCSTYEFLPI